jgi:hypothetical protein
MRANVVKALRSTFGELVQRRLWPVALALVIAIVAVPVLLSTGGSTSTPAATPTAGAPAAGTPVAVASDDPAAADSPASGRGLGRLSGRDPFASPPSASAHSGSSASGATPGTGSAGSGASGSPAGAIGSSGSSGASTTSPGTSTSGSTGTTGGTGSGGGTGTTGTTPTTPTPTPTPAPKPKPKPKPKPDPGPPIAIDVTFGLLSGPHVRHRELPRLSPLPGTRDPVAIFLGVEHRTTAVFLISSTTSPLGDGHCRPAADRCHILRMRGGDTEFLTVTTASGTIRYRLDLHRVIVRPRATPATAARPTSRRAQRWGRLSHRMRLDRRTGFAAGVHAGVAVLDALQPLP